MHVPSPLQERTRSSSGARARWVTSPRCSFWDAVILMPAPEASHTRTCRALLSLRLLFCIFQVLYCLAYSVYVFTYSFIYVFYSLTYLSIYVFINWHIYLCIYSLIDISIYLSIYSLTLSINAFFFFVFFERRKEIIQLWNLCILCINTGMKNKNTEKSAESILFSKLVFSIATLSSCPGSCSAWYCI